LEGRVLVSGGAGFIGSHLIDALVNLGFEVSALDDLSSGSIENICRHVESGRVRFIKGDVRDGQALREALSGCYAVFYLAAVTSVPWFWWFLVHIYALLLYYEFL